MCRTPQKFCVGACSFARGTPIIEHPPESRGAMNPQSSKAERELARAVIECACRCRGATAYAQNVVDLLAEAVGSRLCVFICWESGEPVPLAWTAGAQP